MIQFDPFLPGGAAFAFALALYFLKRHRYGSVDYLPLPPGPKKLPLIGNLLDMPKNFEWITYHKWCKEFDSDIIHLNVAGTSIIVLDSATATTELLESKSSIYSDRPKMPMLDLMGWSFNFALMGYGDRWRHHRRVIHETFHPAAAMNYRPVELKAVRGMLRRLSEQPDDLFGHLRQMVGETIYSVVYGIYVLPDGGSYIATAEKSIHSASVAAVPGTFLVDTFPWLEYVPVWMPFAGFKRKAKEWRKLTSAMLGLPFEAGKRKLESGAATPSFLAYSSAKMNNCHEEEIIKHAAGTLVAAGTETTLSAIASCVLGLITHPEVLKKAQAEIDAVVGVDQLPDFDYFDSLPYITAIAKETLRWRDVLPIALPHCLTEYDVYRGYRLPAGSIVIPNAWAMLHDETVYPEPFEFKPDRFMKDGKLNPAIRDPAHACFGFGRRACPGRYMGFSAIWIAIASLIAAFDITKAVDENGQIIEPSYEYASALVLMPLPFKYSIKPRTKQAEALICATASMEI